VIGGAGDTIQVVGSGASLTADGVKITGLVANMVVTIGGSDDLAVVMAGATTVTVNLNDNANDTVNFRAGSQGTVIGTGDTIGIVGTGASVTASDETVNMIGGVASTITGSNNTINESAPNDTVTATGLNNLVNVTSTGDTVNFSDNAGDTANFYAGSQGTVAGAGSTIGFLGSASVTATGANASFAINGSAGAGQDTITGFQTSSDVIQFNAALFANYSAVMANTTQAGANTVIQINANNSVTLDNVAASSLSSNNFHIS
jgi:hypothetical protein